MADAPTPAPGWADAIARLASDVRALQVLDLGEVDGLSGPGLHAELTRAASRLGALAALVLARVEEDGRWQGRGARTFGEWVARREGSSVGAARREAELGRTLAALPLTSSAVADGTMSLEHAQVIARHGTGSPARMAALISPDPEVNETSLVSKAARLGADEFRTAVQRWAHSVDAAAAEAEHERACAKEHLTITKHTDGVALRGFLTPEHGEAVLLALGAVGGVPAADDRRSRAERQVAALVGAALLVLDRGLRIIGAIYNSPIVALTREPAPTLEAFRGKRIRTFASP
ncbi:MAG TPA: DUF222 domain-containing protein, partial [Verrucomicrobiota bacterium]|nr:DUF222 domain-containing protein [Verrucomicrobiota bacterium]